MLLQTHLSGASWLEVIPALREDAGQLSEVCPLFRRSEILKPTPTHVNNRLAMTVTN